MKFFSSTPMPEDVKEIKVQGPPRAKRRERTRVRYSQFRDIMNGEKRMWEWRPTQEHPAKKRNRNRRRNKAARATRRAHR